MISKKLAAAFLAVSTVIVPFSAEITEYSNVYAEDDAASEELPEWIPTSFEEALNFRNQYGATHIGKFISDNDTVCLVFPEDLDEEMKYEVDTTNEYLEEIYHEVFTEEIAQNKYEVVAYKNVGQPAGMIGFDVRFFCDSKKKSMYSFNSYSNASIEETDVYSWLPDCTAEYSEYVKNNGEVSARDNYVVFCLDSIAGTAYDWCVSADGYNQSVIEHYKTVYCREETLLPLDGGADPKIQLYKAKKYGRTKITYDFVSSFGEPYTEDEVEKKLTADCMVVDGGKTVFLPGTARIRFEDYYTRELLMHPNKNAVINLAPTIAFNTSEEGVYAYMDTSLSMDCNPYIFRYSRGESADIFDIELNQEALPYGYLLPEKYKLITTYDNGAVDVVISLKQDAEALAPGETRVTVLDSDTGKLIPNFVLKKRPFIFGTDIGIKNGDDWMYTGPLFDVFENPCIFKDNLASLYSRADTFSFTTDEQPEVTLHNNGSMEVVFRTKLKGLADINNDGTFGVSDVVLFEKWLLGAKNAVLENWEAADMNGDERLDSFDLALMKELLTASVNVPVAVTMTEEGGIEGRYVEYKVYKEDEKYKLSYLRDTSGMKEKNPTVVDISEEDYRKIMSADYSRYLRQKNDDDGEIIADALYFNTVITYADGTEKSTKANVTSLMYGVFSDVMMKYIKSDK